MSTVNRRHFLMGSLAAPALPLASRRMYAQEAGDLLQAAVIGTGNRGTYVMQGAMEQFNVRMAALCDIKPDRLDTAATKAARDKPRTFRDYRDLLAQKEIDAVFIATPCDLHVEMAIAALKAGKHVYVEKPVGITPESIGKLLAVAREANTVFQVGQQMRSYARLRRTIERLHNEQTLGKIIMVKAQRHASADLDHTGPSADWFFDAKRSGDVIVEMSVHNLDVLNWVIDSRPERAAGFGGNMMWVNDPPGRTNMDGYSLTYQYQNGVTAAYSQVFFHAGGMPGSGAYTYVYGTKGSVHLDTSTFYPLDRGAKPVLLAEEVKEDPHAHITAFFESIRTGKNPPADLMVGVVGALTAILGREAIYRKKVMSWDELGVRI